MIESEKFAHRVLDTSLNGIYIHDVKLGQNIFINSQYTTLTGYSFEDLRAMNKEQFFELFHPDDRQRVAGHMERLVSNSDDMLEIEYRFKTKDGRWIWCLSRDSVFAHAQDGSVSQLIGALLDITERKLLQEDARPLSNAAIRERDGLKTLVKSISDEIWFADTEEKFTLINPSGAMEFAVGEADAIDVKKFAESLEVFRPDGSPRPIKEAPPLRALQGEVVRNQEEIVRTPATGELRHRQVSSAPVRDTTGSIIGSVSVVRDITERRQAEQALKKARDELEEKVKERTYELEAAVLALQLEVKERKEAEIQLHQLSRVFMDASDPIVIENLSGTILNMNREAERVYGWKRQELIGKSIKSIIPQEHHRPAEQLRQRCLNGEEVRNWEDLRQDQFGRKFFVLVTAFALSDESGKPVAVATIAKDITFRKQMESELKKSHQRLRDLSLKSIEALESDRRNVARELHDSIGGSLAAVKFGLEGIVGEIDKRPDLAAESLEKSISYLTDTIKETKRIAANLRPLSLDDLGLLSTIDWHTRQFSQQYGNIRLVKQIDICEEEIPDSSKIVIYRVLQEALNNCAKHSNADTVYIGLKKNDNKIEFELKDNGCGFDVEEVFTRDDPLVGNGLKNMRERTELCGGLFFLNAHPGAGTSVMLVFPLE
jgi:PAS domain S-box-containing protein